MRTVDFYFDVVSPYSWLAAKALGDRVSYLPVLLSELLARGPTPAAGDFADVMRVAAERDFTDEPPEYAIDSRPAMLFLTATAEGSRAGAAAAVMRACYENGEDIADPATLGRIAADLGLTGALQRARESEVEVELHRRSAEAVARGVVGVPSIFVDGQLRQGSRQAELFS